MRPQRWHLPVWPFWLAGAACEAICAPLRHRAADLSAAGGFLHEEPRVRHHPGADGNRLRAGDWPAGRHHPHPALVPRPWLALTTHRSGRAGRHAPADRPRAGRPCRSTGHRISCSRRQVEPREVRGAGGRPAGPAGAAEARADRDARAGRGRRAWVCVLRKLLYPRLLGSCGRNVVFGQNVVLRHPHKIHIGSNVVIDDNCLIDAKGAVESRHSHRQRRVHRPQQHPVVQERQHRHRRRGEHRIQLRAVFGEPGARSGASVLMAAYTYVIGGEHDFSDPSKAVLEQARRSLGVTIGEGAWIGAGAKILDGVSIGAHAVIGAGAVVRERRPGRGRCRRRAGPGRLDAHLREPISKSCVPGSRNLVRRPSRWPFSRS